MRDRKLFDYDLSMVNFEFKIMQVSDLEQVLLIETSSHITPWNANNFCDCLASNYWNYVFVDKESPVNILGHCVVMPGFEEAHLLNITIHTPYRRQGIAQQAIVALEKSCIEHRFRRILLEVRQSNIEAIHLYQKLGFEQIGVRKRYYSLPQENQLNAREDALVMQKTLITESMTDES